MASTRGVWPFPLAALLLASARAQCYLEDAAAECAVCWETSSRGITKGGRCPGDSVKVRWGQPPPPTMTAGTGYPTEYEFKIDKDVFPVVLKEVKGQDLKVSHSNIHSCLTGRGACTPFVGNTPGLSTHTAAMTGNLTTVDGHFLLDRFATEMKLSAGSYTVIAHTRFFMWDSSQDPSQSCYPECLTKVDTAVGILREVVEPVASTSTDAYVGTGVLGGCMLLGGASVAWAARSGRLDMDAILKALTRDEVVLTVDIIIGLGDVVAFTIGFTEEVLVDNNLKDIVPAAILFLVTGWISSLVAAWQNVKQFKVVLESHYNHKRYIEKQEDVVLRRSISDSSQRSSYKRKLSGNDKGRELIKQCERTRRHLWNLYMNAVTLILADIPLTAVGIYVILNGEGVELAVVVALCASTAMVGAKAHGLTGFTDQRQRVDQAEKRVAEFLDIQQGTPEKVYFQTDQDPEALADGEFEPEGEGSIADTLPKKGQVAPCAVSKWRTRSSPK